MVYLYTIIWHLRTFFKFIIPWGWGWRGFRGSRGIHRIGWGPGFVKWRHYKDGMRQGDTITAINWSYRQNKNAQSAQNLQHFIYCFKSNLNANYKSLKKSNILWHIYVKWIALKSPMSSAIQIWFNTFFKSKLPISVGLIIKSFLQNLPNDGKNWIVVTKIWQWRTNGNLKHLWEE